MNNDALVIEGCLFMLGNLYFLEKKFYMGALFCAIAQILVTAKHMGWI